MKKRYLCLLTLCLAFLMMLAACTGKDGSTSDTTAPSTEKNTQAPDGETETETQPNEEPAVLTLASGGKTSYKIINGTATNDERYLLRSFAENLSERTGARFSVYDADEEESEFEILVGKIDSRKASLAHYGNLSYTEYGIDIIDNKIVIGYYNATVLEGCLNILTDKIVQNMTTSNWELPCDYSLRRNQSAYAIPVLDTKGAFHGVYSAGSRNYQASFENVTEAEFDAYLTKLADGQYTTHQTNKIGDNRFGTYTKDKTQICVSYFPSKKLCKITYGALGYLPATEQGTVEQKVAPTVTQMGINEAALDDAPGMSYVMQLSDGRYIIVDGGIDNSVNLVKLLNFLNDNNPNAGKPVIASWIITHAHGDHTYLAYNFLNNYSDLITLESVAYNFPDLETNSFVHEDAKGMSNEISRFKTLIKNKYPKAKTIILHTGMKFYIGDAQFEVMGTHEEIYPSPMPYGNDTSTAFRVTLGGKSIMFFGDTDYTLSTFMASVYGSALKADIMQATHHGFNGATLELYQAVDPDLVFWPCDRARFESDTRCTGTENGYYFNAWLRNNSIKVRKHFHASKNTTALLESFSVAE